MANDGIKLNDARIQAIVSGAGGPVYRRVEEYARKVTNQAKVNSPVDTGLLRSSIEYSLSSTSSGVTATITSTTNYAAAVELGSRPHRINARPGGVLSFRKNGKRITVKWVDHPGARAQPYLRPALEQFAPEYGFVVTEGSPGAFFVG